MKEELYIAFENYLNNEMPLDEKTEFEKKLQTDNSFKNQFELYKETTAFLENKFSSETISFKENLKTISENHFSEGKKTKAKVISLQSKWFAVAAMLVVFIGIWFINTNGNPNYSDYNQHENANFIVRSEGNEDLKAAQEAFNVQNYEKAAVLFENFLKENKKPEVELYYGISLLEINKTMEADKVFTNLKNGTSVYNYDAIWYLALSSLKQEKYEDCALYLKQIPEDSEKFSKAQKLLNDLD